MTSTTAIPPFTMQDVLDFYDGMPTSMTAIDTTGKLFLAMAVDKPGYQWPMAVCPLTLADQDYLVNNNATTSAWLAVLRRTMDAADGYYLWDFAELSSPKFEFVAGPVPEAFKPEV